MQCLAPQPVQELVQIGQLLPSEQAQHTYFGRKPPAKGCPLPATASWRLHRQGQLGTCGARGLLRSQWR